MSVNQTTWTQFVKEKNIKNEDTNLIELFKKWCEEKGIKKVRTLSEKDSTNMIPVFRSRYERDECRRAYIDWYIQSGIYAGMTDKKAKATQKEKEEKLLQTYKNLAKNAYKWFIGGNNFGAEVFKIRNDDKRYPKDSRNWKIEIMSNYNATLDKGEPMWRKKYPTAKRIMSLRINDLVRAEFSRNDKKLPKGIIEAVNHKCNWEGKDTVELNFRVKKLNSTGTIFLRPDWISKEAGDTKSWQASASSLKEHKARKIFVSPAGVLTDSVFSE